METISEPHISSKPKLKTEMKMLMLQIIWIKPSLNPPNPPHKFFHSEIDSEKWKRKSNRSSLHYHLLSIVVAIPFMYKNSNPLIMNLFLLFCSFSCRFCVCSHIYGWNFFLLFKKFVFTLTLELDFFLWRKYENNANTKNVNLFSKRNCDVFSWFIKHHPAPQSTAFFIFLGNLIVLFEFDFSRTTQEKHSPQNERINILIIYSAIHKSHSRAQNNKKISPKED